MAMPFEASRQSVMRWVSIALVASLFALSGCEQPANANSDLPHNAAQGGALQELQNLETLGQQAREKNLPIMFAVGAEWCEFCHQLRDEVLSPMALGGDYDGKYMYMRYFSIDDDNPIPGIDGKPMSKAKWAYQKSADLTPTVIFIDGNGNEVAEKIIGIANIELYTTLIHKRLNEAYEKMDNPIRITAMPDQM